MIAPSYHYEHPYREEIEALEYRPWQLDVANVESKDPTVIAERNKSGDGVWIDNDDDLAQLAQRISEGIESGEIQEIALDLEAHSHRTFAGFVCLVQLSLRRSKSSSSSGGQDSATPDIATGSDFLIDALSLRHAIPSHLGPILCNPNVLKVMHGADSDVPWLQRDFGSYVVNLFDTGRAARALKFPSAGLAYLLRKYANVEADKQHQLSDWRRRPLPEDMRSYAVSDTRYLLDIYDQLRLELEGHSMKDISIASVLDRSKQVCLIRYDKEPFRPSGYVSIMDGRKSRRRSNKNSKVTSELSPQQDAALKALYDWRDVTARREDESGQYVCSNAALLRIASNRPVTVSALQKLVNPVPPLVMRRSQEILDAIKAAGDKSGEDAGKIETAAKPTAPALTPSRNREMLSPILGSDALYKQAGWMTPTLQESGSSGASESEDGVRKFLDVNAANQGYTATQYSSHSIEMSPPSLKSDAMEDDTGAKSTSRGFTADGLGTSRAAMRNDGSSAHEDVRVAQRSANLIQKEMASKLGETGKAGKFGNGFSLIDMIRPIPLSEDIELDRGQETGGDHTSANNNGTSETCQEDDEEEDEMTIPKSMREIYNLSNANRRRTGKEKGATKPLQFPDDDNIKNIPMMQEDFVAGAEAVIASRGGPGGYFGVSSNTKRQRTSPGKDADIKLMAKMGWVEGKKDAESLAVVPNDTQAVEKERHGQGSHYKKANASGGRGNGSGGGSFEYSYAGNQPLFDPTAAPSNNPFFAGAASSAASMVHGESKGKIQKRNKKR